MLAGLVFAAFVLVQPAAASANVFDSMSAPLSGPSISSDRPDYAPGDRVTLSGAHWQPGESVNIVVNDDLGSTWRRDVNVAADASGAITDSFNLPQWFVAEYTVTATGASGAVARTTFTDGNVQVSSTGETSVVNAWAKFNGNAGCTGDPNAT